MLNERLGYQGDELFEAALIAFNQSNWDHAEIHRDNGSLQIQVSDSALAESVKGQKKPVCHPIAGYIAGFLEEAWKHGFKVRECESMALGHPRCLFAVD